MIMVVNFMFAISMCLVMGIFVVTPMDGTLKSMWLHAGFFLQLVVVLMFTMALNFFEAMWNGEAVTLKQWICLAIHVVATLNFGVFASIAIYTYKNDGVPVLPPTFMMCSDYAWFLSMPLAAGAMPIEAPVHVQITWTEEPVKPAPVGAAAAEYT